MKLNDYILSRFIELGYDYVFGYPNSFLMLIWQNFRDSKIKLILATHETNSVLMADGWSRIKREVAFVFLILRKLYFSI